VFDPARAPPRGAAAPVQRPGAKPLAGTPGSRGAQGLLVPRAAASVVAALADGTRALGDDLHYGKRWCVDLRAAAPGHPRSSGAGPHGEAP
jgi:hypothetical protein